MEKEIKKILQDLLSLLDVSLEDKEIFVEKNTDGLIVLIGGQDVGNLIGYHGNIIYALQSLLYSYISSKKGKDIQIYVDIGNYRKKREEQLLDKVKEAIRIVRLQKREYKFLPMRPSDRRLVHLEVSKYSDLVSYSVGEGLDRRVVISLSDLG